MSEVAALETRARLAPVTLLHAGQRTHATVDAAMQALQAQRIGGEIPDTLIFVEHPEVITVGRRAKIDGITAPEGYASREVDRGGGITWHGPGQLVGYPVFRWREESIRTVITLIEEWIIESLATFGVAAGRNPAMMGVWLDGFKIARKGLDGGRLNLASCSLGAAQGALDAARRYMGERRQFGRKLAEFQALQFKLADMATQLVAARQMVHTAARKVDARGHDATVWCAMAKRFATDAGFAICNESLQIHGGYGYIREYPIERLLRDCRVHQILEGTNEIMRVIIARHLLNTDEELR